MRDEINHNNVKIGDVLVISESHYGRAQLYCAKVVRRSTTRLTVLFREREQQWNLDGTPYPRERGYGAHRKLLPATKENLEAFDKSYAARRVESLISTLSDRVRNSNWVTSLVEMEVRNLADVLEKYVKLLTPEEKK